MFRKYNENVKEFKAKYEKFNPREILVSGYLPKNYVLTEGFLQSAEYDWLSKWINAMWKYVKPAPFYKKVVWYLCEVVWMLLINPMFKDAHNDANHYYRNDFGLTWRTFDEYKDYDIQRRSEVRFNLRGEDREKFIRKCDSATYWGRIIFALKSILEDCFNVPKL